MPVAVNPRRNKRQRRKEQLPIGFVPSRPAASKEKTMTAKSKTKIDKKPKQENSVKDKQTPLDRELDRELADSFPTSDPPSVTQSGMKPGAPERKPSSRTSKRQ
jgi:hypothetical protein